VNKPIPHGDDGSPGDFWVLVLELLLDVRCSFTDYFQAPDTNVLQSAIGKLSLCGI